MRPLRDCCTVANPQIQLLVDFLTGNLGAAPQQELAAKVVQLVVAGGSLGQLEVMAAANPYSRQQTTDMEPVRYGLHCLWVLPFSLSPCCWCPCILLLGLFS
eukprot:GHUV01048897.1.p1 GENE.GHUV01048897.1~~GHUV01048897.1.p1  ORF type:complete len:102 (+),score=7.79 GHUV01048897.1:64-369(+)